MKTIMQKRYQAQPDVTIPRSVFHRPSGLSSSFDAGYLIPIFVDEVLPGDTHTLSAAGFCRMSTPIYPILDNLILDTFFFFVPNRLVWNNWVKCMGEQVDPGDSIAYSVPTVELNNINNETLYDYLGLPTKVGAAYDVDNLVGRSFNLIWNEWFRDENHQDSVVVDKDDGPDSVSDYVLLKRGKRFDYFTSALPFLQKGDAVQLSLGTVAPVESTTGGMPLFDYDDQTDAYLQNSSGTTDIRGSKTPSGGGALTWGSDTGLEANLNSATASTVNELRQAQQVQKLLELDARMGTRYREILKSQFGVESPDASLQRPQYLGGGSSPVNISAVARTDSSPGKLGAVGTIGFKNHGFSQSFTEHGHIIGLCCVRADMRYQEGIDRMWNRQTRYDFYTPTLAHLGEQSILNKEIYIDATTIGSGDDEAVFGYQERWQELRGKISKITGKMRSNDAASLDAWHLGIEFGSQPTLDDTFIVENPPVDRVIATPTEPHFILDAYFDLTSARPVPVRSIPGKQTF